MEEKLKKYCTVISGYAFKSQDLSEGTDIPIIKIGNISNGENIIVDNSTQYVNKEFLSIDKKYHVLNGDILISLTGSHMNQPNSMVGRCCRNLDDVVYLLNQRAGKVIPKKTVNKDFLYYVFRLKSIQYAIANRAYGAANQVNVSPKDIMGIKFRIPNFTVQNRIVDILTTYDKLIENNNKRIKLLEQMAENLYKEWFVRFRFPEYENVEFVGTLPIGWQYQPISESVDFFDSQRVPLSSMQRDEMEKIYPYYGAAQLMDYVDDYLFDGEYLLLGEDGTVVTTDGFPVLQLVNDKFWVNNHAHVIRGKGNISTRFLYLTFCRFPITGVVTGSAQPKISKGRLEKLKILVPDAITMEHFNNLINPMFDEINVLKKQLIRITKQRDLLLPRLMSGKIEV